MMIGWSVFVTGKWPIIAVGNRTLEIEQMGMEG